MFPNKDDRWGHTITFSRLVQAINNSVDNFLFNSKVVYFQSNQCETKPHAAVSERDVTRPCLTDAASFAVREFHFFPSATKHLSASRGLQGRAAVPAVMNGHKCERGLRSSYSSSTNICHKGQAWLRGITRRKGQSSLTPFIPGFHQRARVTRQGEMIGAHKPVYLPDTAIVPCWKASSQQLSTDGEGAAEAVQMTGSAGPLCGQIVPDGRATMCVHASFNHMNQMI